MFKKIPMYGMTGLLIFLFTCVLLFGCSEANEIIEEKEAVAENPKKISMPVTMPDDFDFLVKFGVRKRNEINTYENTVTKDLVTNGTVTTSLTFTTEEMEKIYLKMKELNIANWKNINLQTNCRRIPPIEEEWEIKISGKAITQTISAQSCTESLKENQLLELRNYIYSFIEEKEAYKNLPEAEGEYR